MKYVCSVCGYVYDEEKEKIPFSELSDSWVCPLCGAEKSAFTAQGENGSRQSEFEPLEIDEDMKTVSPGVISAIFSNLARGCEKQYKAEEMKLFSVLADYFKSVTPKENSADINTLEELISADIENGYGNLRAAAKSEHDRGTERICVWGEKVTNIANSILSRYKREGDAILKNTEVWVCSVCGFVCIGDAAPTLCPVCKVPNWKFDKIEGRANI